MFVTMLSSQILAVTSDVCDIGSRLELFVDDRLIDKMEGVILKLNNPIPRESVIVFDLPWEGNTSGYVTVFQDSDKYRMYYRGSAYDFQNNKDLHEVTCYAESHDGIHWEKPILNLFEFKGSKENNIVWIGVGNHDFTPFKDTNPNVEPDARYKALGVGPGGLFAFKSPDGIHWQLIQDKPVITEGAFDSQNLAFWYPLKNCYMEFHRGFRGGIRDIMTCTSTDFVNWTKPTWLDYGKAPREHLYTNAITPYFRAPHILMGFPKRFFPNRKKVEREIWEGVSDGVFMTSRDGLNWNRWLEAFVRPGQWQERWRQRNNMTAWGIVVTKPDTPDTPDELSIYVSEGYCTERNGLRRYTLRMDGFVSLNASYKGGEMLTKPITFEGSKLIINYATSAAGSIKVEITDVEGKAIPNFALENCLEIYGDEVEKIVQWRNDPDLKRLEGIPIRLRFVFKDADLYSIRFAK